MFNEDDVTHMMNNQTRIPDGIINGKQYADIFKTLSNDLESTNPDDFQSGIRWIMNCVNACYEDQNVWSKTKSADVVTALAYFSMTMLKGLIELGEAENYFTYQNEEVIPQLFSECETIPWYDFSEDIKRMAEADMENGEDDIVE